MSKIKALTWLLAVMIMITAGTQWANAQTVNWMVWNAPASYESFYAPQNFSYTNGATGQLTLPSGTVVYFEMTGEVIQYSCFAASSSSCPGYFGSIGGWGGYPPGTFTSTNVPSLPPDANEIAQTGYTNPLHTITFYSDAARTIPTTVENIVMNVYSLGGGSQSAYRFTQNFEILSQNPTCPGGLQGTVGATNCLWKVDESPAGYTLYGYEGAGTIQFKGTFSSISWTVTVPEVFSGFNIGVTSAGFDPPCSQIDALTLDEAQWHSSAGFNPLNDTWFNAKFPNNLMVGLTGRSVTLTSAAAIRTFSPQSGVPAVLLSAWTDPGKKLKNELAGSASAAKLNLALSPQLTLAVVKQVKGLPTRFVGYTFKDLIRTADETLGWNGSSSEAPTQAFMNDLNTTLISVNNSFSAKKATGSLGCSVPN